MRLSCIHCGREFSITADQLGGRGRCPHCHAQIQLPKASDDRGGGSDEEAPAPANWLENSISGLASMLIHMALIIIASLITWGHRGGVGASEDVLIGTLPQQILSDAQEDELNESEEVERASEPESLDESFEMPSSSPNSAADTSLDDLAAPSPTGGGSLTTEIGPVSMSGSMSGGSWEGMIQQLKRNGLDIVIAFDSTGSMSGEINEVKRQIDRIGKTLTELVPSVRFSICTYRDDGDDYVVKGLPLTKDIQEVKLYLEDVRASGGGDHPEAVHEGLAWATAPENNQYRSRARKVILLFGDAPPHQEYKKKCLQLAADFNAQQNGIVSTVTCRSHVRIPEFIDIAQMGGGEAFLTSDERQIMTQLLVLVFGSKYRSKVIEAFKLLGR